MKAFLRKEGVFLLALFVIALGLRMIYLGQLQKGPMFDAPIMDAKYHDEWARLISANWSDALLKGVTLHPGSAYFRAPLYAHFLALIYTIFDQEFLAVRVIQFLIGSVSVLLIYFLGRRVFNPLVGKIAGVMAAIYGPFIYFEGELLIPVLILFLNLLLVLAILATGQRPGWWRWLGCGALLGLSAIARPTVLIFLVVLIPWMVVILRRRGQRWPRNLWHLAGLLAGVVLLMLPIHIHNARMAQDFLPTMVSQGGVNFFIGNNPNSDGATAIVPGTRATWWGGYFDALQLAEEAEGHPLKASQVSTYWFKRGLQFMRDEPAKAARLMAKKLALFWGGQEIANNKDIYFFSARRPLTKLLIRPGAIDLPFGLVAPLALAGMILAWRRREGRGAGLLALFVCSYMFGVILFFVNARFRLPVVPFLLPFAAYVLWVIFQKGHLARAAFSIGLILFFGVLVNANLSGAPLPSHAEAYNSIGSVYLGKKMYDQAEESFRLALEVEPRYVRAISGLAMIYDRTDRPGKAIEQWERAISLAPEMMELHFQEGFSYYAAGRLDEAIAAWQEAARLEPDFAQPHFQLGIAYEDQGQYQRAIEEYRTTLEVNPAYILAGYNLGHLYERLGRIDEAIVEFQRAIEADPKFGDVYNSLAWLYAQQGIHLDEGIELANRALELDPESGAYWDTLAELYIRKGELARAREIFRRMLREQKEPGQDFWKQRLQEVGGQGGKLRRSLE
jgi:tetratricopeptide (TPR) repeat protein